MARIKIVDLKEEFEVSAKDLERVRGGLRLATGGYFSKVSPVGVKWTTSQLQNPHGSVFTMSAGLC